MSSMKKHLTALGFMAGVCLPGGAHADEKAPPRARAAGDDVTSREANRHPVRIGPTTVTVIDEQEAVDDVISRVRLDRQQRPPADRGERRETRQQRQQDLKQARRQRAAHLRDAAPTRPADAQPVRGQTQAQKQAVVRDRLRDLRRERDRNTAPQPGARPLRTRAPGR